MKRINAPAGGHPETAEYVPQGTEIDEESPEA